MLRGKNVVPLKTITLSLPLSPSLSFSLIELQKKKEGKKNMLIQDGNDREGKNRRGKVTRCWCCFDGYFSIFFSSLFHFFSVFFHFPSSFFSLFSLYFSSFPNFLSLRYFLDTLRILIPRYLCYFLPISYSICFLYWLGSSPSFFLFFSQKNLCSWKEKR